MKYVLLAIEEDDLATHPEREDDEGLREDIQEAVCGEVVVAKAVLLEQAEINGMIAAISRRAAAVRDEGLGEPLRDSDPETIRYQLLEESAKLSARAVEIAGLCR